MAVPKAPDDAELKNIIEKLAQFVARNGASFEAMTKTKQRDNPRFSFLFGGEGYDYYTYRVTTEQVIQRGFCEFGIFPSAKPLICHCPLLRPCILGD